MSTFMYRRGDGNEGNFRRAIVELTEKDCPYAALAALVANDYISGRKVRRHIVHSIEVDGEAEFGIHATVHEGPQGEQAFGADWLTAELEPMTDTEAEYEKDQNRMHSGTLRDLLDAPAWRHYRAAVKLKTGV